MTILQIESMNSIFLQFIPLVHSYSHYFYWKQAQYDLMYKVALLINAKAHYTLCEFSTIFKIIYT
jgi:hypothetical protein